MGWFDGSSSVSKRDRSPGRASVYSSKSGKTKKVTTGSSFGDWAAGIKKGDKNKSGIFSIDVDIEHSDKEKKRKKKEQEFYKLNHGSSASFMGIVPEERRPYNDYKNRSTASFFRAGSPRSSVSSYKRSPRKGYIARMYKKLRKILKKVKKYLKSHPLKVFMLVIMPLITGGALTALLAFFGLRLPKSIEKWIAKLSGKPSYKDVLGVGMAAAGTSVGRGIDGTYQFERKKVSGPLDSFGGISGVMDGVGGIMSVAKLFI